MPFFLPMLTDKSVITNGCRRYAMPGQLRYSEDFPLPEGEGQGEGDFKGIFPYSISPLPNPLPSGERELSFLT